MVSKEEYEKLFNEIFGVSIKWSKLSIQELTQLATILANPESLIKKLGGCKEEKVSRAVEALRTILENFEYEGPILNLVRRYLGIEKSTAGKETESH